MSPLLSIRDLALQTQRGEESLEILRGVSLDVDAGETVGIVGESGSGKTMTIRAVMGLLPETVAASGTITFDDDRQVLDFSTAQWRAFRRGDVGMVFQDPHASLNPVRKIGDFLTELHRHDGHSARAEARERAVALMEQVNIKRPAAILDLYPHQLSGGMLQRVMIASVLMQRPRLILADEPTTALDVTTQSEVVALLDEARAAQGAAMVFISHDIELVAAISDRILVMHQGRLIESLTPRQLYAGEIAEPYTEALLACRPSLSERKRRLPVIVAAAFEEDIMPVVAPSPLEVDDELVPEPVELRVGTAAADRPAVADAVAAIEVSDLRKTFGGDGLLRRAAEPVVAVDGVSFALEPGRTLAIVGESGSGKTTVARMIMGLEQPSGGAISLFGEPQRGKPSTREWRERARKVQMVFQNPYRSLDPSQPVGRALDEALKVHFDWEAAHRAARISELLSLVRLDESVLAALPGQLSGGQRQRVCIARALAAEPRIVILDEAVAALDVSVQAQVLNVLCDIRDETGVSYLFVTHDLAVVRQIADDVVVMRSGEIVERGSTAAVLDDPQHDYTQLLLDSVPRENWKPRRRR